SLSPGKIQALVRCAKNVERLGDRYLIPERKIMRRRADDYEQILLRAGKPLHYRELARRAVQFGYKHKFVTNILVRDSRFAKVGHSGFWVLSTWRNFETRTITQIAFDEIERARCPLDESQLYALISKQRVVKKRSIPR